MTIGEKAEVAHAVETIRNYMKEKAPNELVGTKAHDLVTVATIATIILPSEGDVVAIGMNDTAVCDSDTMGVAAEIGKHLVRPTEGRLGIDDPFDAASAREMAGECVVVVEMSEFVDEVQLTLGESFSEGGQKESPKQA